jgi:hypothetical protein
MSLKFGVPAMHNEEIFKQVERLLQRKLSPEECKFLIVASQVNNPEKKAVAKAATGTSRVA